MSTPIWFNNPTILLQHNKLKEIWPKSQMTTEEKINAITRLIILLTLLGYIMTLSHKILYIGFVSLAFIVVLYLVQNHSKKTTIKESFLNNSLNTNSKYTDPLEYEVTKEEFTKPSQKNPLMNVLVPEVYFDPKRKPAAPAFNPDVENEINKSVKSFIEEPFNDKNIGDKLFRDLGDEFMFNRSMIQYNSNANTQIPNDQEKFLDYAYGDMISGKEGHPIALERNSAHNWTMY